MMTAIAFSAQNCLRDEEMKAEVNSKKLNLDTARGVKFMSCLASGCKLE